MATKLIVDSLQKSGGTTFTLPSSDGSSGQAMVTNGSGTLSFSNLPAGGKVLQVISGTSTTQTSNTSLTFADTTLTATITPTASNSKILVMVSQWFKTDRTSASTINAGIQLLRGSTVVYKPHGNGAGGRNFGLNATGTSYLDLAMIFSFNYVDSPSTTSATVYKTQQAISEASANMTAMSQYNSGISTITLFEIGA